MPDSPKAGQELNGWKEIASYLQMSVRTAQTAERERGLPVHRSGGGVKSPVFAIASELDAWRVNLVAAERFVDESVLSSKGTERRHWVRYSLIGGGTGLGLALLGLAGWRHGN